MPGGQGIWMRWPEDPLLVGEQFGVGGGRRARVSKFAWLGLSLLSLRVRDDAWAHVDPATAKPTCGCGST
jgi:hypothetical protein